MKKANVIVAATGQGKGKYILSISQEILFINESCPLLSVMNRWLRFFL